MDAVEGFHHPQQLCRFLGDYCVESVAEETERQFDKQDGNHSFGNRQNRL